MSLKTAKFTRTNAQGFDEPQKISVEYQHANFQGLSATIQFQGYKDDEARAKGAQAITHTLNIPLDLSDRQILQAVGMVSQLIWDKAMDTQFVDTYEEVDGKLAVVKKSLRELNAEVEEVDLSGLMKK